MKNFLLLLSAAYTLNANAQWNLKWSHTQSLSGGIYKSAPVGICDDTAGHWIYTASNEYYEPTGDSIKGYISKYDSAGNLQWNLTLTPAVSLVNFSNGGIVNNIGGNGDFDPVVAYNTTPSTSHLIKINPNGTIAWNIVVNGVNNITAIYDDTMWVYIVGRTPQTTCGAFQCNGVAVAKYNSSGQLQWKKTKYTSGFKATTSSMAIDSAGNIIVCGNKAASSNISGYYDKTFVLKYSSTGTLLWTKEIAETISETEGDHWLRVDLSDNVYLATQSADTTNNVNITKLRKLSASNGGVLFTKTINNSELNGIQFDNGTGEEILATSTGMKAYNTSGTLIWSNGYKVIKNNILTNSGSTTDVISKNVNPLEPLKNYLVQLNTSTGAVIYKKDLFVNEAYQGDYCGLQGIDYDNEFILLINDTTAPYGTKATKLNPCSDFTYSFISTATPISVNNGSCNNGQVTVNWTGTFNSWAHLEIYDDQTNLNIAQVDVPSATTYTFQNLTSGNYTVKVFDESCGEQNFNVTVKCPKPSSGFAVTFPNPGSAALSWNAPSCASGYKIQYSSNGGVTWITTTSGTNNKTISGLTQGANYQWKVATKCSGSNPAVYTAYSGIHTFNAQSPRLENNVEESAINTDNFDIEIYPNPTEGIFNLNVSNGTITSYRIIIHDAVGKVVIDEIRKTDDLTIDLSKNANGIYSMTVISGDKFKTIKVVVF